MLKAWSGYIDLSKRRVAPEDITKCEERYTKSKAVASILRHVASKLPSSESDTPVPPKIEEAPKEDLEEAETVGAVMEGGVEHSKEDERLEMLYETIAWPIGKTYGHTYDAFKLALTFVSKSHHPKTITNPSILITVNQKRYSQHLIPDRLKLPSMPS